MDFWAHFVDVSPHKFLKTKFGLGFISRRYYKWERRWRRDLCCSARQRQWNWEVSCHEKSNCNRWHLNPLLEKNRIKSVFLRLSFRAAILTPRTLLTIFPPTTNILRRNACAIQINITFYKIYLFKTETKKSLGLSCFRKSRRILDLKWSKRIALVSHGVMKWRNGLFDVWNSSD